jgi:putative heme-binding domain-containing protein
VPGEETRYFRKTFSVKEPSKLAIDVTADNRFVLYLDGGEIAQGDNWQLVQSVTIALPTGSHVLAAVAENEAPGPAGLLVRGGVLPLGQGVPIHSDATWKTAAQPPEGEAWKQPDFLDDAWVAAADLGALGTGPWQNLTFTSGDTAERFKPAFGFAVKQVASPAFTGSVVSFTFDHWGNPCVGVEGGPIVRLIDRQLDGQYEEKQVIAPQMKNCQGLYFDVDRSGETADLWCVGDGPKGTGIYHWTDSDGDGVYDKIVHHVPTDGMGEHGPHAIQRGPEGSLYFNSGNHAHLKVPVDPASPVNKTSHYEGELLPHYNDARGHAAGIMAPGGAIYRSDDDGMTWARVVAGFRNEYDFSFNSEGEIFSFDSDMEWDVGLPWYRPVRVNFCPPGAAFGWRNGSGKWPAYFYDSLPGVLDIGRGSPTGVTFYQGNRFPPEYDDAFLFCDWSQGRILAARLNRAGAAYTAESWELVTGQPLNCTDIEVGPDSAVYFTTGGRGTLGGLFRVTPTDRGLPARPENPIEEALWTPSYRSSFGVARLRKIVAEVGAEAFTDRLVQTVARNTSETPARRIRALELTQRYGATTGRTSLVHVWIALTADADATVRSKAVRLLGLATSDEARAALTKALADPDPFVRRSACESLVRSGGAMPFEPLADLLADPDRWVRYAARVAIEHGDVASHREQLIALKPARAQLEGMLAVVRTTPLDIDAQNRLLQAEAMLLDAVLPDTERLDLLRLVSLTYQLGPASRSEIRATTDVVRNLLAVFPETLDRLAKARREAADSSDAELTTALVREQARLLAFLDLPPAVDLIERAQAEAAMARDRPSQIHFAYCLRAMKNGWTPASKAALWAWYQQASGWDGGYSFLGYLDFMVQELVERLSPEERAGYLAEGAKTPFPTRVLVRELPGDAAEANVPALTGLYGSLGSDASPAANELRAVIVEKLGQSERPEARTALAEILKNDRERFDLIARSLAAKATPADFDTLVAALVSRDSNTLQALIAALGRLDRRPEGAVAMRNLIAAARRLPANRYPAAQALLVKWYHQRLSIPGFDRDRMLTFWEDAYKQLFPQGPSLADEPSPGRAYTLADLKREVLDAGLVAKGTAERGQAIARQAKCLTCHKLAAEGAGLGPDLTTVWSRFRPEEILEAIVDPSKVISDQYKSVTIATTDGQIYNGMPAGGDDKTIILLLSDGSKITLQKGDIDEQAESKVSVMPAGLIDSLSPTEIADLLAVFAAQPKVEVPSPSGGR